LLVTTDPTALLAPPGPELLARLAQEGEAGTSGLALAERLRREYPADLVAAATAQQELRVAARAKFSRAADMLFTRAGYEQASSEAVATYRAARLRGAARVADLCCGIGGDLTALAAAADVLAVDRDAVHARLARHNAAVYDRADRVTALVADVRDVALAGVDAVFIDPARRSGPGTASAGTARRFRAGASEPSLDWCAALAGRVEAVCVKAAPGLPEEAVPPGWEAEFIAEARDLKEAVLWSPALVTAPAATPSASTPTAAGPRRATVLLGPPAGGQDEARFVTLTARPGDPVAVTVPGEYLLDPNPAVTRAGLVEDLARELGGAAKIDPRIAFLTFDRDVRTLFARTLRVLESAPWNEKQFARRLRELDIGAVDIRRRGLAGDVDQIRRRLKLAGRRRATVVITRVSDKPWGLICVDPDLPATASPGPASAWARLVRITTKRSAVPGWEPLTRLSPVPPVPRAQPSRSTHPRTYAACPTCCMSSSSTETSRTPSVTGGVHRVSTTRSRSASVTWDTSLTVCVCTASWYSCSSRPSAVAEAKIATSLPECP
jgi:SAM-dependent methyltransferase